MVSYVFYNAVGGNYVWLWAFNIWQIIKIWQLLWLLYIINLNLQEEQVRPSREINKNNLLGMQLLIFLPKKSRKIISCVGSIQFSVPESQIMSFPGHFEKCLPLNSMLPLTYRMLILNSLRYWPISRQHWGTTYSGESVQCYFQHGISQVYKT